jgi:hypothetical protein
MVVKKGQLVEHEDNREALKEARRLARKLDNDMYVVEVKAVEQARKLGELKIEHTLLFNALLNCHSSRVGHRWTPEEEDIVVHLWRDQREGIADIAAITSRNPYGIECRLRELGFYIPE